MSGRFIMTAAGARLDIEVNIFVDPRPVIFPHEGATGLVNCKMVAQIIMVEL